MAIIFNVTDTAETFDVGCSGASAGATTAARRMGLGSPLGSGEVDLDADNQQTAAVLAYRTNGGTGADTIWHAGDYVVELNVTAAGNSNTWKETHICERTSGGAFNTVASLTGQFINISGTGRQTMTVNRGTDFIPAGPTSDLFVVIVIESGEQHGGSGFSATMDVTVETPLNLANQNINVGLGELSAQGLQVGFNEIPLSAQLLHCATDGSAASNLPTDEIFAWKLVAKFFIPSGNRRALIHLGDFDFYIPNDFDTQDIYFDNGGDIFYLTDSGVVPEDEEFLFELYLENKSPGRLYMRINDEFVFDEIDNWGAPESSVIGVLTFNLSTNVEARHVALYNEVKYPGAGVHNPTVETFYIRGNGATGSPTNEVNNGAGALPTDVELSGLSNDGADLYTHTDKEWAYRCDSGSVDFDGPSGSSKVSGKTLMGGQWFARVREVAAGSVEEIIVGKPGSLLNVDVSSLLTSTMLTRRGGVTPNTAFGDHQLDLIPSLDEFAVLGGNASSDATLEWEEIGLRLLLDTVEGDFKQGLGAGNLTIQGKKPSLSENLLSSTLVRFAGAVAGNQSEFDIDDTLTFYPDARSGIRSFHTDSDESPVGFTGLSASGTWKVVAVLKYDNPDIIVLGNLRTRIILKNSATINRTFFMEITARNPGADFVVNDEDNNTVFSSNVSLINHSSWFVLSIYLENTDPGRLIIAVNDEIIVDVQSNFLDSVNGSIDEVLIGLDQLVDGQTTLEFLCDSFLVYNNVSDIEAGATDPYISSFQIRSSAISSPTEIVNVGAGAAPTDAELTAISQLPAGSSVDSYVNTDKEWAYQCDGGGSSRTGPNGASVVSGRRVIGGKWWALLEETSSGSVEEIIFGTGSSVVNVDLSGAAFSGETYLEGGGVLGGVIQNEGSGLPAFNEYATLGGNAGGGATLTWHDLGYALVLDPAPSLEIQVFPGVGALVITGQQPSIEATVGSEDSVITVGGGTASITYLQVEVAWGVSIDAGVSSVSFTGKQPTIQVEESLSIEVGVDTLSITGFVPSIDVGGSASVNAGVGPLSITGQVPETSAGVSVEAGVSALSVAGHSPSVDIGGSVSINVEVGSLSTTGLVPDVTGHALAEIGTDSLSITGIGPEVVGNAQVDPSTDTLIVSGNAPQVVADTENNAEVLAGADSLSIVGLQPSVVVGFDLSVEVGLGQLSINGNVPALKADAFPSFIGLDTLNVQGQQPTSSIGLEINPGLDELIIQSLSPQAFADTNILAEFGQLTLTGHGPSVITALVEKFSPFSRTLLVEAEERIFKVGREQRRMFVVKEEIRTVQVREETDN